MLFFFWIGFNKIVVIFFFISMYVLNVLCIMLILLNGMWWKFGINGRNGLWNIFFVVFDKEFRFFLWKECVVEINVVWLLYIFVNFKVVFIFFVLLFVKKEYFKFFGVIFVKIFVSIVWSGFNKFWLWSVWCWSWFWIVLIILGWWCFML